MISCREEEKWHLLSRWWSRWCRCRRDDDGDGDGDGDGDDDGDDGRGRCRGCCGNDVGGGRWRRPRRTRQPQPRIAASSELATRSVIPTGEDEVDNGGGVRRWECA